MQTTLKILGVIIGAKEHCVRLLETIAILVHSA